MNISDISGLISLADATLQQLHQYNSTGAIGDVVRSIRVLSAPLVAGDEIIPELSHVTAAKDRYDLHVAIFGLYGAQTFMQGQRCVTLSGYVLKSASCSLGLSELYYIRSLDY